MVSSEFGRTPKINKDAGRDHWPKVFSVVLAGGGIKKGLDLRRLERHGQRAGARPDRPRGPGDDRLPPARHRRRQGADGPRRPADRDRRRRQGPQGADRLNVRAARRSQMHSTSRRRSRAGPATVTSPKPTGRRIHSHRLHRSARGRVSSQLLATLSAGQPEPGHHRPTGRQRHRDRRPTFPGAGLADGVEMMFCEPGFNVWHGGRWQRRRSR